MRVHVDDLPRIESTRTSSIARRSATRAYFLFHLSRPASAAPLSGELATTISGIFSRSFCPADLARDAGDILSKRCLSCHGPNTRAECGPHPIVRNTRSQMSPDVLRCPVGENASGVLPSAERALSRLESRTLKQNASLADKRTVSMTSSHDLG